MASEIKGKPLKAAFVTSAISRTGAGVSAAVEALSGSLALVADLEVRVFSLSDRAWEQGDNVLWAGAEIVALPVVGPYAFGFAPEMLKRLIDWSPDVVHCHGAWMHPSRTTLQWARATGRPFIVSPHGMLGQEALKFSPAKKRISRFLYQDACFHAASLLCASALAEAEDFRAFGLRQPIAVIPNGVQVPDAAAPQSISPEPYVLSLGRIHAIKGLDRLVLAWKEVEPDFPNWRLKIVGPDEGGYSDVLLRMIHELGLKNVSVSGPVFGEPKVDLLRGAELFALPTLNENFAMTVAESLAVETPVISTKGAPWAGLVEHKCGWWIDHGAAPMAAALREAMEMDRAELQAMGKRGRLWMARDFSWDRNASEMLAIYEWIRGRGEKPSSVLLD